MDIIRNLVEIKRSLFSFIFKNKKEGTIFVIFPTLTENDGFVMFTYVERESLYDVVFGTRTYEYYK